MFVSLCYRYFGGFFSLLPCAFARFNVGTPGPRLANATGGFDALRQFATSIPNRLAGQPVAADTSASPP